MCPDRPDLRTVAAAPSMLPRPRWQELAAGLAAAVAGAAVVAAVPALRHAVSLAVQGDLGGLRDQFLALGIDGVLLLLALILAHAVVFYPTELVTATAGLVYGFLPGLALVTCGWLASALLAYLLGRAVGEPLGRLLFGSRRFLALRRAVERGGAPLLLALRLIPIVPFSLTGYVAGAARVPLWRFGYDDGGGLPAADRARRLPRLAESLVVRHGPAPVARRRRLARAARRRPPAWPGRAAPPRLRARLTLAAGHAAGPRCFGPPRAGR